MNELSLIKRILEKFENFNEQCRDQCIFLPAEIDSLLDELRKAVEKEDCK
jgi:predicted ATP-grasp superfamily ATP-dependent carboligase